MSNDIWWKKTRIVSCRRANQHRSIEGLYGEGVGEQPKAKLVVLHTIKYAFAKWCSIWLFERFMHCLGSRGKEGGGRVVVGGGGPG